MYASSANKSTRITRMPRPRSGFGPVQSRTVAPTMGPRATERVRSLSRFATATRRA